MTIAARNTAPRYRKGGRAATEGYFTTDRRGPAPKAAMCPLSSAT
jgi:hypothetical protein